MLIVLWILYYPQRLWALDAGLENEISSQEMVHRSARRVGLDVPELYNETRADEERKQAAAAHYLTKKKRGNDAKADQ